MVDVSTLRPPAVLSRPLDGMGGVATAGTEGVTGGGALDRIRVLIVDDHVLYRRGLELVLSQEPDIEVVAEGGDGDEAIALARACEPDVVLMDVRMPRRSGIEACRTIRDTQPQTRVVMLTTSDDERDLYDAVRAGANGYLLKDVPPEEVVAGVRTVNAGQSLISPSLASALLSEFAAMIRRQDEAPHPAPRLTDRELQVLRLVARGMSNQQIARQLFISGNTVKNHVRNILDKLGLHSRMEAALFAVRESLIEDPPR